MNLRICDGGRGRAVPASLELVEQVFAPDAAIADGTEIAVAAAALGRIREFLLAPG